MFYAEAFAGTPTITVSSVPGWVKRIVDASVVLGTVANVSLTHAAQRPRRPSPGRLRGRGGVLRERRGLFHRRRVLQRFVLGGGTCAVACTSTDVVQPERVGIS